jgi:DNA polymerase-3 subunit epsilon
MINYLFYDTETSGFISGKKTFDDPTQAFAVQLGALLCDFEGNELNEVNKIIKSNGRFIDPRTIDIHGITEEISEEKGIEEHIVLEEYALLLEDEPIRVCHNVKFDEKFLTQMFQRNMGKLSDYGRSRYFLESTLFCTMQDKKIKKWCDLKNVKGHIKPPKLTELYMLLFEEKFENEHDAIADTRATKRCFFELIKRGIIEI